MKTYNGTSTFIPFIDANPNTGEIGVILPQSSQVLFESDIDSKIKKTKSHIDHLSNAQSHRNTHGGKRFRAKQISLQGQVDIFSKRLTMLKSAKEFVVKLNNNPLAQKLTKNSVTITNSVNSTLGLKLPPVKYYTKGQSSYTPFLFGGRQITVLHANYQTNNK